MNGKICDRCGVLYKPEAASPIYKKVMPYGIYEEVDLCYACRESFKAWMDFYNGTKKPNQDNSDPWVKMSQSK